MSENINVLVWRAEEVDAHGDLLSPQALQDMADRIIPGTELSLNFDIRHMVGRVFSVWIEGKDLWVSVRIDDPGVVDALRSGRAAVRPGFEVAEMHTDNVTANKRVIDSITQAHVSVTTTPMHLPGDTE